MQSYTLHKLLIYNEKERNLITSENSRSEISISRHTCIYSNSKNEELKKATNFIDENIH